MMNSSQQQQQQQQHDLQFQVQNPDGTFSNAGYDAPLPVVDPNRSSSSKSNVVDFVTQQLSQSSHPTVIVFHLLFKVMAVLLYIFADWMIGTSQKGGNEGGFITWSVICILVLAADFWVVKNITGRLLVGLRWWNQVNIQNDTTTWIFESAEQYQASGGRPLRYQVNPFDKNVFWTVLYLTPLVWGFFFIMALISFHWKWLLVDGLALALASANVYGYYKCSTDQKARFERMIQQGAQQGAMVMMRNNVLSMLTGTRTTTNANTSATYV